ncbi:MFS transporter [Actinomyces minihominis]|uniref:MFS transporter n=1 Tax=Actinomyces minihominis TaxID=2002838 RepID=UPI001A92B419|nr:MFS transporter [Actinomyces minihominis]
MTSTNSVEEAAKPTRKEWLALGVLSVGLGLIVLDGTIVGVALPIIIQDLKMDITDAQWVNSLYAVLLGALLLSSGSLSDRWGRKKSFLIGIVIFVAGSVLAAMSGSAGALIGSRVVQAIGAAMIMPSALSTVNAIFRGKYRAAAFGVWGAVISGAAAVGPLAGGALTQYASWHWIFLVNVPIGALLVIAAFLVVPETKGKVTGKGVDVDGALLSAIGFGALVFAIIEGPDLGWWKPESEMRLAGITWPTTAPISPVPIAFVIAIAALTAFGFWEVHRKKIGRSAILDLSLFKLPTFTWGNITAATVAAGEFALIFVLPLYLVNALGLDVMGAGLVFAAMAVGAFMSGAAARHVAAKFGSPGTVVIGLGLELIGVAALAFIVDGTESPWLIAVPLVVYGLGLGLASAQLTGTVLRDVPVEISGQGSATQSTVRQLGSALGTAISGAALSVSLMIFMPHALDKVGFSAEEADKIAEATRQSAGSTISMLRAQGAHSELGAKTDEAVKALSQAFANATSASMAIAAVFLGLGLIGAIRLLKASAVGGEELAADKAAVSE